MILDTYTIQVLKKLLRGPLVDQLKIPAFISPLLDCSNVAGRLFGGTCREQRNELKRISRLSELWDGSSHFYLNEASRIFKSDNTSPEILATEKNPSLNRKEKHSVYNFTESLSEWPKRTTNFHEICLVCESKLTDMDFPQILDTELSFR